MSNPLPLQYGKYYHIYNRGNNRENIFFEERNCHHFLQLYAKHIEPIADTYAYCLLRNHFHFLVRIKTPDLTGFPNLSGLPRKPSQHFSNLFNAYTKAVNKAYGRTGSLFQRPFGRIEVTSDLHFVRLIIYIHHNPQKHGFVDDFGAWPFSSYQALMSSKATRLKRDQVLGWFGGPQQMETLHREELAPLLPEDF